eukprot:CAMPEP_0185766638 /NCGR_PEP_ID=MMETSP1174-20130828/38553_1 /TAXON_ID=35687 /ORGANISM="Dictyocha speculum, Strain CCMP1381" /LENGTH=152 /DNA_ID=CAMNT_0028450417 /DNA_START=13 /DNA_END=471 /DNA_ORIENTATION=-
MRVFFLLATLLLSQANGSYLADVDTSGVFATCPVTLANITDLDASPVLEFDNGQKLYFSSEDAVIAYTTNPKAYWLSPFELPLDGMDGKVGVPNFMGETFYCPYSAEEMIIDMKTPRVVHRGGQNVYFCCFGCIASFWTDPASAWTPEAKTK